MKTEERESIVSLQSAVTETLGERQFKHNDEMVTLSEVHALFKNDFDDETVIVEPFLSHNEIFKYGCPTESLITTGDYIMYVEEDIGKDYLSIENVVTVNENKVYISNIEIATIKDRTFILTKTGDKKNIDMLLRDIDDYMKTVGIYTFDVNISYVVVTIMRIINELRKLGFEYTNLDNVIDNSFNKINTSDLTYVLFYKGEFIDFNKNNYENLLTKEVQFTFGVTTFYTCDKSCSCREKTPDNAYTSEKLPVNTQKMIETAHKSFICCICGPYTNSIRYHLLTSQSLRTIILNGLYTDIHYTISLKYTNKGLALLSAVSPTKVYSRLREDFNDKYFKENESEFSDSDDYPDIFDIEELKGTRTFTREEINKYTEEYYNELKKDEDD